MMYEFSRLRTGRRLVELPPVFFLASEEWLLLGFEFESVTDGCAVPTSHAGSVGS